MRKKKLKLSAVLLLGLGLTVLHAQEAIPVTGSNTLGSTGTVSWSVGQVIYNNHTGTNGSVWEGVQQPFEISIIVSMDETKDIRLSVSAYPNPTDNYLTLSIDELELTNLSFQLYDMNGKLLQNEKITGNKTRIVMNNFMPATYFLKVNHFNEEIKTFKIIKN